MKIQSNNATIRCTCVIGKHNWCAAHKSHQAQADIEPEFTLIAVEHTMTMDEAHSLRVVLTGATKLPCFSKAERFAASAALAALDAALSDTPF